ncbi:hypothetical protein SAMN04487897_101907 [Paenibacillus sp. yr247]|uniref:hypothetical protein n=1 Tax=Paenibacillus sp. yr247 TaxID=1761880 RepID=UPI0008910460|nr:hypothetical protein [Paenibacillus sp. yr247]SDN04922.1 hypothetical protein SAMN04487897_101907 [Paenibacillus sp. yr247]
MNQNNSNPNNFFDFEQLFRGKMPYMPLDQLNNPEWIQNYMQLVLNAYGKITQEDLQIVTSETDHYIIVKIRAPETINLKRLRVLASTSDVKLEGLPGNKEQVIKLPTLVHSTSGRAFVKADLLEIKIRKQNADDGYHEVIMRNE